MATNEGDKKSEGKFLNNIAGTYEIMADFENAIKYYEMRSKLAKSMKDAVAETKCCASIGNVLHVSGNIRESIKYFERVVVCIKLRIGTYAVRYECALNIENTRCLFSELLLFCICLSCLVGVVSNLVTYIVCCIFGVIIPHDGSLSKLVACLIRTIYIR